MKNLILSTGLLILFLLSGCINNQQIKNSNTTQNTNVTLKSYSMDELSTHNQKGDCWLLIHDQVVDVSNFTKHPGGDAYVPYCGKEATAAFETKGGNGQHSDRAHQMMESFVIGQLSK